MTSQENGNTVFLTEQEVKRIQNVVTDRSKKCSEVHGQAREPREAEASIKGATGASLMADMAGGMGNETQATNRGNTLPVLAVGQLYPPCTASSQDLQPIKLAELKLESHHHGRKLIVKRVSPVVTLTARSWTMIQDEEGEDTERLEVVLHKLRRGDELLESSKLFVIKEPFMTLTEEGEPTIQVDHPSDLVVLDDEALQAGTVAPTNGQHGQSKDSTQALGLAKKAKAAGDSAVKKGDMLQGHAEYTRVIDALKQLNLSDESSELMKDTIRSRATVNFSLNQADEGISDAKASLMGKDDQNSKTADSHAYTTAAQSAYRLKDFDGAKHFIERTLELAPENNDASAFLRKVEARIKQQETGKYDMKKIRAGLSRARPEVDAADFLRKTEIKESPGRGRGLYAACDIPSGATIMCEKAFCVVWGYRKEALTAMTYDVRDERIRVVPVGLTRAVVQKLIGNPSLRSKVLDLYGDYQGDVPVDCTTDEGPVVDVFRIHDIVSRNAFSTGTQFGEENAKNASTGLWIRAVYGNHSCSPNANREYTGDLMIVRATRAIKAGEEIFHSYIDPSLDYDARQKALMDTWGFECDCKLCDAQKAEDPAVKKKRKELIAEAEQFLGREGWRDAKRLTIVRAQRLVNSIEGTYDQDRYNGLQYRGSVVQALQDWLSKASPRK